MSELKTQKTEASVKEFINSVDDEQKRKDSFKILEMMEKATGDKGKMWGKSIIGMGEYSYKTADGKEHEWFRVGFSPRKQQISLYILDYPNPENDKDLLEKLGKYKTGKSCLYIKRLSDVDEDVLKSLIERAAER